MLRGEAKQEVEFALKKGGADDIRKAVAYYGIKIVNNNQILCPFHPDHKPSCTLYKDHGHCFACGKTFHSFDLVELKEGLRYNDSLEKAWTEILGYPLPEYDKPKSKRRKKLTDSDLKLLGLTSGMGGYVEMPVGVVLFENRNNVANKSQRREADGNYLALSNERVPSLLSLVEKGDPFAISIIVKKSDEELAKIRAMLSQTKDPNTEIGFLCLDKNYLKDAKTSLYKRKDKIEKIRSLALSYRRSGVTEVPW